MWERVQTYLLVTLVTVLIWVWAESETTKTEITGPTGLPVATKQFEARDLPILLALPPDVLPAGTRLSIDSPAPADGIAAATVMLEAPVSLAAAIADGSAGLRLVVYLSRSDLEAGLISKQAELEAGPADIRLVSPGPMVRVRVMR